MSVEERDIWFATRIKGLRKAVELLLKKTGVKFCMRCFNEIEGEAFEWETVDVLGEKRVLTLCKPCYEAVKGAS
jgi:hypothetical protein